MAFIEQSLWVTHWEGEEITETKWSDSCSSGTQSEIWTYPAHYWERLDTAQYLCNLKCR